MAIGHRAFFRREGEIVDALIVREPRTAVELFDRVKKFDSGTEDFIAEFLTTRSDRKAASELIAR